MAEDLDENFRWKLGETLEMEYLRISEDFEPEKVKTCENELFSSWKSLNRLNFREFKQFEEKSELNVGIGNFNSKFSLPLEMGDLRIFEQKKRKF